MILVDGHPREWIPVSDRGLQYGDGLFETLAVRDGRIRHWQGHWRRLLEGCRRLGIEPPREEIVQEEVLRVGEGPERRGGKGGITRGAGGRGYAPPAVVSPTRIVSGHPWPAWPREFAQEGVALHLCRTALGDNPTLAGIKHLNRLEQVLARGEWDDPRVPEGLMRTLDGRPVCGTMSNLFLHCDGRLVTPTLDRCGIRGVTRAEVLGAARSEGIQVEEIPCSMAMLERAEEVFLTNSIIGIWPVRALGDVHRWRAGPWARRLGEWVESQW